MVDLEHKIIYNEKVEPNGVMDERAFCENKTSP
jgi:hypothetical protein